MSQGLRLLLISNRKSHKTFQMTRKSSTLGDLDRPLLITHSATPIYRNSPRKFEKM